MLVEVIAASVLNRKLSGVEECGAQIPQVRNPLFEGFGRPEAVAIETDLLPAEPSELIVMALADTGSTSARQHRRLGGCHIERSPA